MENSNGSIKTPTLFELLLTPQLCVGLKTSCYSTTSLCVVASIPVNPLGQYKITT